MTTATLHATPAKLRDGSWGARVRGIAHQGDAILIMTRSGKSWTATVQKVLWTGDGVSLVATSHSATPSRSPRRMGPGHGSAAPVAGYSSYCTDRDDCGCYDCAS